MSLSETVGELATKVLDLGRALGEVQRERDNARSMLTAMREGRNEQRERAERAEARLHDARRTIEKALRRGGVDEETYHELDRLIEGL